MHFEKVTGRDRFQRLARLQRRQRTFEAGEIELCRGHAEHGEAMRIVNGTSLASRSNSHRTGTRPLAGLDERDLFAEFDQPVGIDQRGQQSRALARKFHRLERAVRGLAQGDADIFAAGDFLLVGESRRGPASAAAAVGRAPDNARIVGRTTWTKVTKLATGLPGKPMNGVPPIIPIATGRPGLIAIRHSTSVPTLSTLALT